MTKKQYEAQAKEESKAAGKPAQVGPRVENSPETAEHTAKPAKRDTGERDAKGGDPDGKRLSGLDAAAQVLADAKEPLNTKDMVERMLAKGLWKTSGKTPAATIYAAMIREIAAKGDNARFRKVERGKFELRH